MRGWIIALALLWPLTALGQSVPGRFPPGTVYGNKGASEANPSTITTFATNMTTAQRDALTPTVGQTIYNTTSGMFEYWNGTAWVTAPSKTFDVTRYGAVCDGVANDTTAIQNALTAWKAAAPGLGGNVILSGPGSANKCKVTAPLNFTNTNAGSMWGGIVRDLWLYGVFNYTGRVGTVSITNAGNYTASSGNATYTNVPLTGGSGTGCTAASITVAGGLVTNVVLSAPGCNNGGATGFGYDVGNTLSAATASLGGTGTGGLQLNVDTLSGGAVIDAVGARFVKWDNVTVEGDCTNTPNAGWAIAKLDASNQSSHHHGSYARALGCWKFAGFYNAASESSQWDHLFIYSERPTAAYYGLVEDGMNYFNWYSSFQTVSLPIDSFQSFNGDLFNNLLIQVPTSAAATPIWIGRAFGHRFIGSYAAGIGQCGVTMYSSSINTRSIQLDFDMHFETGAMVNTFCLTTKPGGDVNFQLIDFNYTDYQSLVTGNIFKPDANVSTITARSLLVDLGSMNAGASLFGTPAIWTVVPNRISIPIAGNYVVPGTERTGGWICIASNACRPSGGGSGTDPTNTYLGRNAGLGTLTGSFNSGFGLNALSANVDSSQNTGLGAGALANTVGLAGVGFNTALGASAGANITSGTNNTVLGNAVASSTLTTGSANILIGTGPNCTTAAAGTNNQFRVCASNPGVTPLMEGDLTALGLTLGGDLTIAGGDAIFGVQTSVIGTASFANATSGTVKLQPTTGILGSSVLTLPAKTAVVATTTAAATTTNNCAKFDASGNIVDAGAACGTGAGTVTSIAAGTGITVSPSPIIGAGTVTLANPSATTIGGVQSKAAVASQWLNSISTSGVPSSTQPTLADISGVAAGANNQVAVYTGANAIGGTSNHTISTGTMTHGVAGSVVGSSAYANATSGTITLTPVTGVLSGTLNLPVRTATATVATTTGTLTNGNCVKVGDTSGNMADAGTPCVAGVSDATNSFVGAGAALPSSGGTGNTGMGQNALNSVTTGTNNSSFGVNSGTAIAGGSGNVAFGVNALPVATASTNSTAIGTGSLALAVGNNNTVLGVNAGNKIQGAGASNLILGPLVASTTLQNGTNNILLGTAANCDTTATGTNNQFKVCAGSGATDLMVGDLNAASLALTVNGTLTGAKGVIHAPLTFATLPTATAGTVAYITDGLAASCADTTCTTFGTNVTAGGGALKLLVWRNGTNWTLMGK